MAAEMAIPMAAPKEDAILYIPDAEPAFSSGTEVKAASAEGVAYKPRPIPKKVKPIVATILYWAVSRWVKAFKKIPKAVIAHPKTIGLRGPHFCNSFSPTLMAIKIP